MTLTQAKSLKVGDQVLWPSGANGCTSAKGMVEFGEYLNLCVLWEDGQRTYLHDENAVKYIQRAKES